MTDNDLLKLIVQRDTKAVHALLDWLKTNRPLSVAIDRIQGYIEKYSDDPEKLCDYTIRYGMSACPKCASQNTSVHNYNMMWHDGDIICDDCGTHVRDYDAG